MSLKNSSVRGVLLAALLASLLAFGGSVTAQEKKEDAAKPAAEKNEDAKPRGRLPAYFAAVVNQEQREKIYGIQESYRAKIETLQKQLTTLIAERDKAIDTVLTPEQLKEVSKKREEAQKKREAGAKKEETAPKSETDEGAKP